MRLVWSDQYLLESTYQRTSHRKDVNHASTHFPIGLRSLGEKVLEVVLSIVLWSLHRHWILRQQRLCRPGNSSMSLHVETALFSLVCDGKTPLIRRGMHRDRTYAEPR